MTKLQLPIPLQAPLDSQQMKRISSLYGTYGILKIKAAEGAAALLVEFDATRFTVNDVKAALARAGFALAESAV